MKSDSKKRTALLVIDVQNDFCDGGSLAVFDGAATATRIAKHIREHGLDYFTIIASKDCHFPGDQGFVDSGHFASSKGEQPDYVNSWPDHCVAGTPGSEFHPDLNWEELRRMNSTEVVYKGEHEAAYSAFQGHTIINEPLDDLLRSRGIDSVEIVGIATDYCVKATALDAAKAGFETRVRMEMCAYVAEDSFVQAIIEMQEAGVNTTTSFDTPFSVASPAIRHDDVSLDVDDLAGGVEAMQLRKFPFNLRPKAVQMTRRTSHQRECGYWMPVARKRCVLPQGHPKTVHHTSVRTIHHQDRGASR